MLKNIFGKLGNALAMAHIRATDTAKEIKSDERAMEVIQVVMLIAVGVIAIAAVWAAVNGLLEDIWNDLITPATGGEGGPDLGD